MVMGLPTSSRLIATQLIYIQFKKIKIWWGAFLNIKCAKSVPNTHFCVVKYLKFISKFIPDVIVRRFFFFKLIFRGPKVSPNCCLTEDHPKWSQ